MKRWGEYLLRFIRLCFYQSEAFRALKYSLKLFLIESFRVNDLIVYGCNDNFSAISISRLLSRSNEVLYQASTLET